MKSKKTAYLLWFFFGFLGVHKFYLNKTGIGVLYVFTVGFFGVGWLIDAFTLGKQVDKYNTIRAESPPVSSPKEMKPKKTLAEKLQEQKEKSIQEQIELKKQYEEMKNAAKKQREAIKNAPKPSIPVKIEEKPEEKAKIIRDVEKKNVIQTVNSIKDRQIRVRTLEKLITDYLKSYYAGEMEISDSEFDLLWDELKALCPESKVLTQLDETPIEDLAYQAVVNRRKSKNTLFHIEYVDSMGNETSRDIEINRFDIEDDRFYIYAYCHLRKESRQFLVDRIASISCEGHTIQNPRRFLWDMYTK
jgi:hypothetical protein